MCSAQQRVFKVSLILLICAVISINAAKKVSEKIEEEQLPTSEVDEDKTQNAYQYVYNQAQNSPLNSNYFAPYNYENVGSAPNYYSQYKYPQRQFDSSSNYYSARQGKYSSIPIPPIPDYSETAGPSYADYVSFEPPPGRQGPPPPPLMDNLVMASSHGGGHGGGGHGGGHGGGWGHGPPKTVTNYKVSTVSTDAIGLLGLLGLLSILQAVLLSLTTTTAAGRKRREANGVEVDPETEMVNHVSKLLLPSFNVIASAKCKKIPLNCTHHEVCRVNSLLINDVGGLGLDAGEKITDAISGLLARSDEKLSKEIELAGEFGRNGLNQCQDVYPICKELEKDGVYSLPLLLHKSHPLYYDHTHELKTRIKH